MATITITETMCADQHPIFSERCMPNVRWAGPGLLEQLWVVIEYRAGREWAHREEWREVPNSPSFDLGQSLA